ncbi:MAG: DNA methyltransferase [Bacteroidota bacterium]
MPLSFIKSSGNIITEDFCLTMAGETKADYVKDKSFGPDMKKVDETIAVSFDLLRERWEEIRTQLLEDRFDTANLRKRWIIPFLEMFDFKPVFVPSNTKSKSDLEYHISYKGWDSEYAPFIHMVHSTQDFDHRDINSRTHKNKSPQDCLQQFLNTSPHQWAILINGKKIRILRDFYHSITKGFIEFDLEGIFETRDTEQFRVLYRILHRSRFENQYQGTQEVEYDDEGNPIEIEDNCLLEKFHKKSRETGVKVGNKLRDQVIDAIEKLGNGFAEDLNPEEFQNGKVKEFYNEILNIIYRLLFLMFAEQKGWLPVRNNIYAHTYSINALREKANLGNYSQDEEKDLWEGLRITFRLIADGYSFRNGDKINAFGGQLFSDRKIKNLLKLSLKNKYLLDAIYGLSYFKLDKLINRINYANLAIDELGSVYESLLDYEPKIAIDSCQLGSRQINKGEFYLDDRGTDRKTTGSYYTDSRLVAQLIESALVPVIDHAVASKTTPVEKEAALLDLKVADIACGSGAFLCAALEKMGERLALIRMGDEERPTDEQLREAKRDVLLQCIHGVDLNPMAVELAKFSLWITASLPDMPLSFLDHKLKCGNSLIGSTPVLIEKGIPEEAYKAVGNDNPEICTKLKKKVKKQLERMNMVNEPTVQYAIHLGRADGSELLRLREKLNNRKQEFSADVEEAEEEYRRLEKTERKFKEWLMADVWIAAFFIEKTNHDLEQYPTNATLESLRENQPVNSQLIETIIQLAKEYNFFHFHLEFPEVFEKGGFDCLLGNPPWEKLQVEDKKYFKGKNEAIVDADALIRESLILDLKLSDPLLYQSYINEQTFLLRNVHFLKNSKKFELSSSRNVNTYLVFAENYLILLADEGFAAIITPSGIATDDTSKDYFGFIVKNKFLKSLFDFENNEKIFDIHRSFKFNLLTLRKIESSEPIDLLFFATNPNHVFDDFRHYSLSSEEFSLINPNTVNCPVFRNKKDANIVIKIYRTSNVINNEITHQNEFGWTAWQMVNDTHEKKILLPYRLDENSYGAYEGKLFFQYNHRYSNYDSNGFVTNSDHSPSFISSKRYSILKTIIDKKIEKNAWTKSWQIVFRLICRATDNRTFIASIIPRSATMVSAPTIVINDYQNALILLANLNSFTFDYIVRTKIGGTALNHFIVKQLPLVPLKKYSNKLRSSINERVLKLSFNCIDLIPLAEDFGIQSAPFEWNEKERFQLQTELDAVFAHLYGLEKEEMDYILETFPIVKRKDIAKYGSYRTKETILQLYDEFVWVQKEI